MMVHDAHIYFAELHTLQNNLLTALELADPDLDYCHELAQQVALHLQEISTLTEPFDHEQAFAAATHAQKLLQKYHERVLHLRQQRQHEQQRSARDQLAVQKYARVEPPESPLFIDERR
jgi:hypothetical protein